MQYLLSSQIIKANCPEGQHAHFGSGGKCHDANKPHKPGTGADRWHREHGLVTSDDKDKPKEDRPKDEPPKSDVPPHIEYREISRNERASDIDTAEAEWIFRQGTDGAFDRRLEDQKKYLEKAEGFIESMDPDNTSSEEFYQTLVDSDIGLKKETVGDKIGKNINGDRGYKYADLNSMQPKYAKQTAKAIILAKKHMVFTKSVTLGAVEGTGYVGVCWSHNYGTSTVRLRPSYINKGEVVNAQDNEYYTYNVVGEVNESTAIHEMTHAYINNIISEGITKGNRANEIAGISDSWCSSITHGDIPKSWGGKPIFREDNCSSNYEYFGRFTQTVVSDAKKVAKALYGMDNDMFMHQMTLYGRTKAKEGIPEAVADYILNGEKATLANKLIYFSLQRYANFVYTDQKDIQPIGDYIKELKKKQKEGKKKKKSVKKSLEYISFAELMEMDL